jgi:hypothetical protein
VNTKRKKIGTQKGGMVLRCALVGVVFVISGCNESPRNAVSGTVTFEGQPLADGYVMFVPLDGTPGPTAGAMVENGKFEIAEECSVFAGNFRVEIVASRPSNRKVLSQESGKMVNVPEQYIPIRYNQESELQASVEPGGENRFEFALSEK